MKGQTGQGSPVLAEARARDLISGGTRGSFERAQIVKEVAAGLVGLTDLPLGCKAYRITPEFTEATVPTGLLRSHRTAPGTWALIRVLEGRLLYRVLEPRAERALDPAGPPDLVQPGVPHEVALHGPVRFQVKFYRMTVANGGVVLVGMSPRSAD